MTRKWIEMTKSTYANSQLNELLSLQIIFYDQVYVTSVIHTYLSRVQ